MDVRRYQDADETAVVRLWKECDLVRPWNDPFKDIQRKLTVQPELFLVGLMEVLVGYLSAALSTALDETEK